jgi:hypothetical protein
MLREERLVFDHVTDHILSGDVFGSDNVFYARDLQGRGTIDGNDAGVATGE